MKVRYLGHPAMWPRSTWTARLWCRIFGHDWAKTSENSPSEPRCYNCGASPSDEERNEPA